MKPGGKTKQVAREKIRSIRNVGKRRLYLLVYYPLVLPSSGLSLSLSRGEYAGGGCRESGVGSAGPCTGSCPFVSLSSITRCLSS